MDAVQATPDIIAESFRLRHLGGPRFAARVGLWPGDRPLARRVESLFGDRSNGWWLSIASRLRHLLGVGLWVSVLAVAVGASAAELKPQTIEAFDRYVQVTESRMEKELNGESPFLWIDRLDEEERAEALAQLRAGDVVIDKLETRDDEDKIDVPSGMIHHWVGTVLIPEVTLAQTISMVQDYERYAEIYNPDVRASEVRERNGSRFRVWLRLYTKKVITWVANTEHDVEFIFLDDTRAHVPSYSTRIVEVENPDTPEEREQPEGNDRGFAWRLYNYCSFEERAEDVVMQCESITLTRGIPFILSVFIRPFVSGVPREKLTFTLDAARRHLTTATN